MNNKELTILHFSDFHLDGDRINEAENLMSYFCDALAKMSKPIDLVVFSGDMVNQGGKGFKSIREAFEKFDEIVISKICKTLKIGKERFVFTYGNHDIVHGKIPRYGDIEIDGDLTDEESVDTFMRNNANDEFSKKRFEDIKAFEDNHFSPLQSEVFCYIKGEYQSNYILTIGNLKVGVSSLNTIWRCGLNDDKRILLGMRQIDESTQILKNCDIRIATTHYRYDMLKEFEKDLFKDKLADNYDMFFSGHTHSNHVEFAYMLSGNSFLDVNTAGSLSENEYTSDDRHKNAFQIVTYYPGEKVEVSIYCQENGGSFEICKKYGEDGIWSHPFPTSEESINRATIEKKENEEREKRDFLESIKPIKPLEEYRKEFSDSIFNGDFETNDKIDSIKSKLADDNKKRLRLMALSGMGKTRMVFDVFRDKCNVYYTPTPECFDKIPILLGEVKDGVLIIDNCPNKDLLKIENSIKDLNSQIRIISIYNNLIPDEKRGNECLPLDIDETADVIDKMLEKEPALLGQDGIKAFIKERSENIPFMTKLMIDAYKRNGDVKSGDITKITNSLLDSIQDIKDDKQQIKALHSLSLFEPLGYINQVKDEYDYVTNKYDLHQIAADQDVIINVFDQAIKGFEKRQLIEIAGNCLRIRPRPLSEWMTETWVENNENSFGKIYDDITKQNENLSQRLTRALCNRFSEMSQSSRAKQLFDKYNNPDNGSFHDERIAFSKSGSQLFLSMGLVSPVMVSRNLESLISSKSIDWLKNELDHEARRNLIWAMENIVMHEDAFEPIAKSLGRLALAENKQISNIATDQFFQLFHLGLSGTKANLKARINILHYFEPMEEAQNLLLGAIDHAFISNHFVRFISYKGSNDEDYQPTYYEIEEYWTECLDILIRMMNNNPDLTDSICKILEKHVHSFHDLGLLSVLFEKLETFAKAKNNQWVEMRDELSRNLNYWTKGTKDELKQSKEWIEKLSPKTFYAKLQVFVHDELFKRNSDWKAKEKNIEEGMMPFVTEFLDKEIYKTNELDKMIGEQKFNLYQFIHILSQQISKEQLDSLLGEIFKRICNKDKDIESSFVYILAEYISNKELIKKLNNELYKKGYFRMYSSLLGILDQQNCDLINDVIKYAKNGIFDDTCVNNYLRRCGSSIKNIFSNFSALNDAQLNPYTIVYPHLLSFICFNIQDLKEQNCLDIFKRALLSYPFSSEYRGQSQDIIRNISDVLDVDNDAEFAYNVHSLVVKLIVENILDSTLLDHIYHSLLPKYQDAILDDLLEVLVANDNRLMFFLRMYLYLGSGFGQGKGPLFQCDESKLKEKCSCYPSILPQRLARMCPIYDNENGSVSLSKFFLWLCDNYGDDKRMLNEFACNMETEGWTGFGGYSDYVADKKKYIEPLIDHPNETVRQWAKEMCNNLEDSSHKEREKEEYSRMVRG